MSFLSLLSGGRDHVKWLAAALLAALVASTLYWSVGLSNAGAQGQNRPEFQDDQGNPTLRYDFRLSENADGSETPVPVGSVIAVDPQRRRPDLLELAAYDGTDFPPAPPVLHRQRRRDFLHRRRAGLRKPVAGRRGRRHCPDAGRNRHRPRRPLEHGRGRRPPGRRGTPGPDERADGRVRRRGREPAALLDASRQRRRGRPDQLALHLSAHRLHRPVGTGVPQRDPGRPPA